MLTGWINILADFSLLFILLFCETVSNVQLCSHITVTETKRGLLVKCHFSVLSKGKAKAERGQVIVVWMCSHVEKEMCKIPLWRKTVHSALYWCEALSFISVRYFYRFVEVIFSWVVIKTARSTISVMRQKER